ncbi:MAG TPA: aminotransferase class I/II-fold pyridoxal phosphate-dependent enzyme [Acidimicrobiia bacterium]
MNDAYQPPIFGAPIDLDLSRNEGLPTVTTIDLDPQDLAAATSRYPDTTRLAEAVAARHGLTVDRVLVTAGGDDALFRCLIASAGRAVVATTPTFEMVRRYAAQLETPLIEVPWWDGDFPVDGFLTEAASSPGLAVLVSPNNPTGNVVTQADLRKVSDAYPLVVLDAAYEEFAVDGLTAAALEMVNVVVIRTLSKAFGLAGLRVGYLLSSPGTVRRLAGFGSPYAMSALSAALATDALSTKLADAENFAVGVTERRERLIALLDELGCEPLPSQGNFVLATAVDPSWVVPAAASLGIGLRSFADRPELARCVRITVPATENDFVRLETTLRSVLAPRALLFDMDGVLADVKDSFRAAIVATAATFGVTVSESDIAAAKARGNASDDWELTRDLCASAGVDIPLESVRERFEMLYQGGDGRDGLKMRERLLVTSDVLASWSKRFLLGIVTARPRKDAAEFLARFEIGSFFSTVVTREDAASKPDPEPVRLALSRLGVDRGWMFGDTVDDLSAARRAGVVPIGVALPGDDRSALAGSARVVDSVDEIEEVLNATKS